MSSALSCNGSRVLSPAEADAIRAVITKPSGRALFDALLYSGLRFSELRQVADEPERFDEERGALLIKSTKPKAKRGERNVFLGTRGREAVRRFLDSGGKIPNSATSWQMNLIRWAEQAGLSHLPGTTATGNPFGITVRSSRKTWESWLLTTYPERLMDIIMSQGHSEGVAIRHYVNLAWTGPEREAIRIETEGWPR